MSELFKIIRSEKLEDGPGAFNVYMGSIKVGFVHVSSIQAGQFAAWIEQSHSCQYEIDTTACVLKLQKERDESQKERDRLRLEQCRCRLRHLGYLNPMDHLHYCPYRIAYGIES